MSFFKHLGFLAAAISIFNIVTKLVELNVHEVIEGIVQAYYAIILPLTTLANYLLNEALEIVGYSLPPINPDWFALYMITTASFLRSIGNEMKNDENLNIGMIFLVVLLSLFLWPVILVMMITESPDGRLEAFDVLVELLKVIVLAIGFLAINGALVG